MKESFIYLSVSCYLQSHFTLTCQMGESGVECHAGLETGHCYLLLRYDIYAQSESDFRRTDECKVLGDKMNVSKMLRLPNILLEIYNNIINPCLSNNFQKLLGCVLSLLHKKYRIPNDERLICDKQDWCITWILPLFLIVR